MCIVPLEQDGLLKIKSYENKLGLKIATKNWLPCQWFSQNTIFKGMHIDGVPNGFIRAISESGEFFEGMADSNFGRGQYGWAREFSGDYVRIGWWTNWCWIGNCRRYCDGYRD